MPRVSWFYAQNDTEHGPVTLDQVRELLQIGSLGRDDLVWSEGMDQWRAVRDVPDLNASQNPLGGLFAIPMSISRPAEGLPLLSPPVARLLVLLALFSVLTAEGCEQLAERHADRTGALLKLEQAAFEDQWEQKRERLDDEREKLREDGIDASETSRLKSVTEELADLPEKQDAERKQLDRGRWRTLKQSARDADSRQKVWSFWRAGLILLGTLVLASGLMILGATSQGAEQWLAWGMLIALLVLRLS